MSAERAVRATRQRHEHPAVRERLRAGGLFAGNLSRLRRLAGMNCYELAEAVGVDHTYIGHMEAGRRTPGPVTLDRLAEALGAKVEAFFLPVEAEEPAPPRADLPPGPFVPLNPERPKLGWIVVESGCHIWTGAIVGGYGQVSVGGKRHRVHRYRYEREVGPIPEGLVLDHFACDNPACCNPAHVRPVTHWENTLRRRWP